jgi:HAD superfamily hydrolase (TIGR01509 family)
MKLAEFRALILDMDGVFVDTEPIIFQAFRVVFTRKGIELSDDYLYGLVGDTTLQNLRDISRDYCVELDAEEYIGILEETYYRLLDEVQLAAREGIWSIIDEAKSAALALGLCTSSKMKTVSIILQKVLQHENVGYTRDNLFDAIVAADMVSRKKPHPEPYEKVVASLGLSTDECLVIEDSASGVLSAKRAGCHCIALRNFYNEHEDFSLADRVVSSLGDL